MEDALRTDPLADELAEHLEFLRRTARALVRDEQVAEDVVQETLLAALASRPSPAAGIRAWLRSVLRRRVLLHFRTEQRRVAREALLQRDAGEDAGVELAEADRAMASLERSSMLGRAVAALEDPYRTVIVLRFYEGLQPKAISERLARPVNTVNTQLQRGLAQLRRELDAEGGGRRAWVSALLPFAIDGRDGWWPTTATTVAGGSFGLVAACVTVVVAVLFGLRALHDRAGLEPSPPVELIQPSGSDASVAVERQRPPRSADRSAVGSGGAQTDPPQDPEQTDPGGLRLHVRSATGPVAGARVAIRDGSDYEIQRISTELRGEGSRRLKVAPAGMFRFAAAVEQPDPGELVVRTDLDGVAELQVLDGERSRVRITADGYAPKTLLFSGVAAPREETVTLQPACRVVVQRGSFPLDRNVLVFLKSHVELESYESILPAGIQETELQHVAPGTYRVEALSSRGEGVSHWSLSAEVRPHRVTRIDLALDRRGDVRFEVQGAHPLSPAEFVHVHGPNGANGSPEWNEFMLLRSDVSGVVSLPAGPAVARVRCGESEVGRSEFAIASGAATHVETISIAPGQLRVLHEFEPGSRLELTQRSDGLGARDGWLRLGAPLSQGNESTFRGLLPGDYRLWVSGPSKALAVDFAMDTEPVEIDVRRADTAPVELRLGAGCQGDPFEIDIAGRWRVLRSNDGFVRLSYGSHRLRTALEGMGHVERSIEVPRDSRVAFDEAARTRPIVVDCGKERSNEVVRLEASEGAALVPLVQQRTVALDAEGTATLELRPGTYALVDRFRRSATVTVRADSERVEARFE